MTLREMFEKVMVESGQYLIPVEDLELNMDRFMLLVRSVNAEYNKYEPHEKKFNLQCQQRSFTFTNETVDILGAKTGIPYKISNLTPIRIAGVSPFFLREFEEHRSPYLNDKVEFPWEYRKPILYVPIQAQYDIHAWYQHEITPVPLDVVSDETVNKPKDYEVITISDDDIRFFKLLTARFMKGLASSRRSFTMTDIPLMTDATDLMSDAKTMEEEAKKEMQENQKWWLAWA